MKRLDIIIMIILSILMTLILLYNINSIVQAAYNSSDYFVNQKSDSITVTAEVKDNTIPVVNSYGMQDTLNPQKAGLNQ